MLLERRKQRKVYIPNCSMADIAFLLLTFFMVTTSLDMDKGLGLTLPPVGGVRPIPKKNIISLLINASGDVMLDEEKLEVGMINSRIIARLKENPLILVSIKTDVNTKYQSFVSVLDQVQMAMGETPRISIAEPE
ncbi:biopolymer transporter ExbD [bacterium]|nr:biopolymer transporter ExbD [bacterium]